MDNFLQSTVLLLVSVCFLGTPRRCHCEIQITLPLPVPERAHALRERVFRGLTDSLDHFRKGIHDTLLYHLLPVVRYRTVILSRLHSSIDQLKSDHQQRGQAWTLGVQAQVNNASAACSELREQASAQATRVSDICEAQLGLSRQRAFLDQSIESFHRRCEGSLEGVWGTLGGAAGGIDSRFQKQTVGDDTLEFFKHSREKTEAELRGQLRKANRLLSSLVSEVSYEHRRVERVLECLRRRQGELLSRVRTKAEARLERIELDRQITEVYEGWFERQTLLGLRLHHHHQQVADTIQSLLREFQAIVRVYDELVHRKEAELLESVQNDLTLKKALDLIMEDDEEGGWELVNSKRQGNMTVHRKFLDRGAKGSKFACVKASYTMAVPPGAIAQLFESSERVQEYNKWYLEGCDLEEVDPNTKVVWASSPAVYPFKARDYCSLVHYRRLEDGTVILINRGAEHPDAPVTRKYVRAEIIMGANIIRPDPANPNRTRFTMLTQVDPGGIAPAWIINKISAYGPVDFMRRIEVAAACPSKLCTNGKV